MDADLTGHVETFEGCARRLACTFLYTAASSWVNFQISGFKWKNYGSKMSNDEK